MFTPKAPNVNFGKYLFGRRFEIYNWRQNELRHFALNGLFDVFRTSKGEKIAFPPPSPPCNVVPLFELPLENKKHPNFEWRGQGRGVDSYASEVTLFEYNNFSQQFCRRLKSAVPSARPLGLGSKLYPSKIQCMLNKGSSRVFLE